MNQHRLAAFPEIMGTRIGYIFDSHIKILALNTSPTTPKRPLSTTRSPGVIIEQNMFRGMNIATISCITSVGQPQTTPMYVGNAAPHSLVFFLLLVKPLGRAKSYFHFALYLLESAAADSWDVYRSTWLLSGGLYGAYLSMT